MLLLKGQRHLVAQLEMHGKGKPKDTFRSAPIEPCENLGGARLMPYAV
jgi:hypothetical protein